MSCAAGEKILGWKVKYSADSAEFCPVAPHEDIFVVGTYELVQNTSGDSSANDSKEQNVPQCRQGCLYLHRLSSTDTKTDLQEIQVAGILDMKWSCQRVAGFILLGIVTSVGELIIYKLLEENNLPTLQTICRVSLDEPTSLALSLDWSNRKTETNNPLICVSDSKGYVNVFQLSSTELTLLHRHRCHDFECWITAFNYWDSNTLYSGGDDAKFRSYDLRAGLDSPIFTSKVHQAGVTSCHSNDRTQYQVSRAV